MNNFRRHGVEDELGVGSAKRQLRKLLFYPNIYGVPKWYTTLPPSHGQPQLRIAQVPVKSAIPQRSSMILSFSTTTPATSLRRMPAPNSKARTTRSRFPRRLSPAGVIKSADACCTSSQLPSRTPEHFRPCTRVIAAATAGSSNPLSAASVVSRRTAASRWLMVDGASLFSINIDLYCWTRALLNSGSGWYGAHVRNSSIAAE